MLRSCLVGLSCIALLRPLNAYAQEFLLGDQYITTCTGVLYDPGGADSSSVGDMWWISTICPSTPGTAVVLDFTVFDLGPGVTVSILDGPHLDADLLMQAEGQELQGLTVTATVENPGGCLTVRYGHNNGQEGDLQASISCGVLCPAPHPAFAEALGDTVYACVGAPVFLDGSASTAQTGQNLLYWHLDLDEQHATLLWPHTTFTLSDPGVYRALLTVTDDAGCTSPIPAELLVLVAPPVHFQASAAPAALCPGDTVALAGTAMGTPLLLPAPVPVCDGSTPALALPDILSELFTSTITRTDAEPGAVITDVAQLGDICLNIEHSFMGDLFITITCPNDSSIVLHADEGGGTFLGDPFDDDDTIPVGTCYTYCFSATPTHGTWAECSYIGDDPNLIQAQAGRTLAPGRYTSLEPLEGLLGCPVNGDWTLTFQDMNGADSGVLCTWCFGSGPAWDSSFVAFGPMLGSGAWSGTGVVNEPGAPGQAIGVPDAFGVHDYVFSVSDSYGCVHDTTIAVNAYTFLPELNINGDGLVCISPVGPAYAWSFNGEPVAVDSMCWMPPGLGLIEVEVLDPEVCVPAVSFIVNGIDGIANTETMRVFPVPNTGAFTVSAEGLSGTWAIMAVLDGSGRTIHQARVLVAGSKVSEQLVLHLQPGIYSLRLSDGAGVQHMPFTVVR